MKIFVVFMYFVCCWYEGSTERSEDFGVLNLNSNNFIYENGYKIKNFTFRNCSEKIHIFENALMNFITCAVTSSYPLRLCQNCFDNYITMRNTYNLILQEVDYIGNTTVACDKHMRADKIQIVTRILATANKLWVESFCEDCFVKNTGNETTHYKPCDYVVKFEKLQDVVNVCLKNYSNEKWSNKLDLMHFAEYSNSVCQNCLPQYEILNKFYDNLMAERNFDGVCMDIVVSMNNSRTSWSKHFNCTWHRNSYSVLFAIMMFCCLLPLVFYFSASIQSEAQEDVVTIQKRLIDVQPGEDRPF